MKRRLPLYRSILWILSSAVMINLLAFAGIKGYFFWKRKASIDFKVPIKAIVQTGPQKEALNTTYLAELLDLSVDRPLLSSEINLSEAEAKLLASPVIKTASVKLKEPGILFIDYTTRQPIAFLHDFENIALDKEGYPFPVTPFYSPKNLPEIYLGKEEPLEWNQPIISKQKDLAFDLFKILSGPVVRDLFNIKRIDVSNAFAESYGRREIVLLTEDEIYSTLKGREILFIFPRLLRLSTKNYSQELSNYLKLRATLLGKEKQQLVYPEGDEAIRIAPSKIIDFRINQLAFIEEGL